MIDISIISEVTTQGKEFEPGVLSKDGGLEMDWSFITYLTVRIKDNAVTKQHFYCSDRQKMYCYCSAKAIYYKQRTEKGGDRAWNISPLRKLRNNGAFLTAECVFFASRAKSMV